MKKIRLLLLIDQLGGGGAERVVVDIATHLPPSYEVFVIATRNQGNFDYIEDLIKNNITVHVLSRHTRFDLKSFLYLRNLVSEFKPDILHTHKLGANLWGRLLRLTVRVPILVSHEHTWSYEKSKLVRIILNRLSSRLSDSIIAVSKKDKEKLISVEKLPIEKISTIYNGIDFSRLKDSKPRKHLLFEIGKGEDTFLTAIIGKLLPQKGHEILLEAIPTILRRVDKFHLLIVGEGKLERQLKEQVEKLGIKNSVSFLGFRKDIGSILNAVNLVVMPSLFEGHPLTLIEAMYSGKVVIASNVGGVPEVIEDGKTGLLIPPGSSPILASKILQVISDYERYKPMGVAASQEVRKRFSIDIAMQNYVSLYSRLLSRKGLLN